MVAVRLLPATGHPNATNINFLILSRDLEVRYITILIYNKFHVIMKSVKKMLSAFLKIINIKRA